MTFSFFETRADSRREPTHGRRRTVGTYGDLSTIERGCTGCPLVVYHDKLRHPVMQSTGVDKPVLYVIGEAPGADEDREGRQFVGSSGSLLREVLGDILGPDYPIRWDNSVRCRPPNNRAPDAVEQEHCRGYVLSDIQRYRPQVVLGVGGAALRWAIGASAITRWRRRLMPVRLDNCDVWFYATVHPSFVLRQSNDKDRNMWLLALRHDIRYLARVLSEWSGMSYLPQPQIEPVASLYDGVYYARDADGLRAMMRQLASWSRSGAVVAWDIETSCLRPYAVRTALHGWLSVAFSDGITTWAAPVCCVGAGWSPDEHKMLCNAILSFLLGDAMKVAHSLPFELEWTLCIYGDRFRPLTTDGYGDTMVQAYVLDERRDGLDLSMLTMQHFGFDLKRQLDVDRNNLAKLPVDRLLRYNALDAKYTARVYMRQHARLQRENLLDVYRFQLGRVLSLVRAQEVGIPVDLDSAAKFHARLTGEINDVLQRIQSSREARQYQERTGCVLLPTSSDQLTVLLRDVLRRSEGQRVSNRSGYSTDDSVLSRIDLPVTRDILELRNRLKLKSTYIDPIVSSVGLVYPDGRLHTKFNDLFTTTGRLSSDGPNMQNFPKRKDVWVRALVVAPPGQVLVACDYGQQEYRVLAIASGDKRLLSSIRDGYDVHMDWAERVARADDRVYRAYGKDMKRLRSDIKNTWVFPAFYGAQADYIARMLSMNVQAARKLFDVFWEEFEGVLLWQQRVLRRYREVGYVECLTGRRRRAPLNNNMVYNSPIQGTASDIVIDAMTRLDKLAEHSNEPALRAVLNIHDDLTFLVPERCQEEVCDIIVREMLESSFDWITVPLSVEVSVGRNWADCNKVGVFTK